MRADENCVLQECGAHGSNGTPRGGEKRVDTATKATKEQVVGFGVGGDHRALSSQRFNKLVTQQKANKNTNPTSTLQMLSIKTNEHGAPGTFR